MASYYWYCFSVHPLPEDNTQTVPDIYQRHHSTTLSWKDRKKCYNLLPHVSKLPSSQLQASGELKDGKWDKKVFSQKEKLQKMLSNKNKRVTFETIRMFPICSNPAAKYLMNCQRKKIAICSPNNCDFWHCFCRSRPEALYIKILKSTPTGFAQSCSSSFFPSALSSEFIAWQYQSFFFPNMEIPVNSSSCTMLCACRSICFGISAMLIIIVSHEGVGLRPAKQEQLWQSIKHKLENVSREIEH